MRPPSSAALLLTLALGLAGCSGSSDGDAPPAPTDAPTTSASPSDGSSAPTLTPGGTELATGEPATVLLRRGDGDPGVADVTLTGVSTGTAADLAAFSLEGTAPTSVPWYVRLRVTDRGLGPLGGATVPLTGVDASGDSWPVTPLVGSLPTCEPGTLPETVATGASQDLCLLYLLPSGARLEQLVLSTSSLATPLTWDVTAVGSDAGSGPSAGPTPQNTATTP